MSTTKDHRIVEAIIFGSNEPVNESDLKEKISDKDNLIDHLNKFSCSTTLSLREKLSSEAFATTGSYDAIISNYFNLI